MKHIFMGSINKKNYYSDLRFDFKHYGETGNSRHRYMLNWRCNYEEWKEIGSSSEINFPLNEGDRICLSGENLYILNRIVNDDGTIVCQTSKVLETDENIKEKESVLDSIKAENEKLNSEESKSVTERRSWWNKLFV